MEILGHSRYFSGDAVLSDERTRLIKAQSAFHAKFSTVEGGMRQERDLPFDPEPRVVSASEFAFLERGLIQRVTALNMFLADVYGEARILGEHVLPSEFVLSSSGFMPHCVGVAPRGGVYAHVAGIDLVKDRSGKWYVLEDNLRVPSGASYPLSARRAMRECGMSEAGIEDSLGYGKLLKGVMDFVSCGGISAVLTSGRSNCAYYEHSTLAELTSSALCEKSDLFVDGDVLYFRGADGMQRVGALYSRIDGVFADPLIFCSDSFVGVPNLFSAYAAGNVAVLNAFGCGVADDKGVYHYVPKMIEYYLGEKPIIENAPTYLPVLKSDLDYIEGNLENLVVKSVDGSGGHGVVFAGRLGYEERARLMSDIRRCPRGYIAQEIIDFESLPTLNGKRKADLRAFVVTGEKSVVWKSGLTRYAGDSDGFIVNSSQGGGFKDTWVLSR